MNKEERTRQFAMEMEIFGDYVLEWGGEHFDYDKTANALDKIGYRKIVWHKVAEGDLPTNNQEIRWLDNTNNYYNGIYCDDAQQFHADVGCYFDRDEVIAWTELPTYTE